MQMRSLCVSPAPWHRDLLVVNTQFIYKWGTLKQEKNNWPTDVLSCVSPSTNEESTMMRVENFCYRDQYHPQFPLSYPLDRYTHFIFNVEYSRASDNFNKVGPLTAAMLSILPLHLTIQICKNGSGTTIQTWKKASQHAPCMLFFWVLE